VLFCFGTLSAWGQSVATGELFSVQRGSVEFFNYEGPHETIESDSQIRGIGRALSTGDTGQYVGKYRISHIPPETSEALGADVLEILSSARVDHIDNIRRIISGYVAERYGYSRTEADTIALFATFYNAVYRGDMEYISGVYSQKLVKALDSAKAGIATSYREWAGNTQLLIPLSLDGKGEVRISADTVGDETVVEEIRKEESDRGTDERKGMVELREEQLEEDKTLLSEQEQQVEEKQKEVEEKEEEIEEQEKELQEKEAEIEEELEKAPEGSEEEKKLQEEKKQVEREQERLEEEKKDLEEDKEQVAEEEAAVEEKKAETEEREAAVDQEREKIARDEQEAISEREEAAGRAEAQEGEKARFSYMRVRDDQGVLLSTLMLLSSKDGSELKRSGINTIRGRRVYPVEGGYVAVAGLDEPPQSVHLVLLDENELAVTAESSEKVYGESWVLVYENSLYAAVLLENNWKLGRFNATDLRMIDASISFIDPNAVIEQAAGAIIVQDNRGTLMRLDPKSLKRLEQ